MYFLLDVETRFDSRDGSSFSHFTYRGFLSCNLLDVKKTTQRSDVLKNLEIWQNIKCFDLTTMFNGFLLKLSIVLDKRRDSL